MAHFTFDTAWIVAHMQASNNEALKEAISNRLIDMRYFADEAARRNFANFETYCWAWQNDCLSAGPRWEDGVRLRPPVNCYPYKPDNSDHLDRHMVLGDDANTLFWNEEVDPDCFGPCETE